MSNNLFERNGRKSGINSLRRDSLLKEIRRKCYTTYVLRRLVSEIHVTSNDAKYQMIKPLEPRSYTSNRCRKRCLENRYELREKLHSSNPIPVLRRTSVGIPRFRAISRKLLHPSRSTAAIMALSLVSVQTVGDLHSKVS
jgi:hypothetical protein